MYAARFRTLVLAAGLAGCFAACDGEGSDADPVIARAYGNVLSWSELRQVIPLDASPEDSAAMAKDYITNWLRQRVLLHKAEENLSMADKDVEQQLEQYRRSLVIYAYENALVEQKLDTTVTQEDIARYYEENLKNFELKDNIVRVRWFKVREEDNRTLKRLEKLFHGGTEDDLSELEVWLAKRGSRIIDTGDEWVAFSDLQKEVPIVTRNATDLLNAKDELVVNDSSGTYFVHILEHRLKDSTSPMDIVSTEIKAIIINKRKLRLIERMREDLYREAIQNKEIIAP